MPRPQGTRLTSDSLRLRRSCGWDPSGCGASTSGILTKSFAANQGMKARSDTTEAALSSSVAAVDELRKRLVGNSGKVVTPAVHSLATRKSEAHRPFSLCASPSSPSCLQKPSAAAVWADAPMAVCSKTAELQTTVQSLSLQVQELLGLVQQLERKGAELAEANSDLVEANEQLAEVNGRLSATNTDLAEEVARWRAEKAELQLHLLREKGRGEGAEAVTSRKDAELDKRKEVQEELQVRKNGVARATGPANIKAGQGGQQTREGRRGEADVQSATHTGELLPSLLL